MGRWLAHMGVGRIPFLEGCWTEGSSKTVDWRPPSLSYLLCGPLHRAAHDLAAGFPQSKQAREPKGGARESLVAGSQMCHAITFAHLSSFYHLEANHLVQPTLGRGLPKGLNARTWGSPESSWEGAYPSVIGLGTTEAFRSGFSLTPSHPHYPQ